MKTVTVTTAKAPVDLSDTDWQLVIDSYGPTYKDAEKLVDPETGIQTVDPSDTTVTRVDFGARKLATWSNIQATSEQMAAMGVSNMNEVDRQNYDFAKMRCDNEWTKALELMNFYDLYQDAPQGPTTKLEENWTADVDYFNGDRRYF